jgi:hypothetical protein
MNFHVYILIAYFGSFSCINAYKFKGLLGHKNPVPSHNVHATFRENRPTGFKNCNGTHTHTEMKMISQKTEWRLVHDILEPTEWNEAGHFVVPLVIANPFPCVKLYVLN